MHNKEIIIDFINYGIIASIFLVIPFSNIRFLAIIIPLIFDFIMLYLVEKKENENERIKKSNR